VGFLWTSSQQKLISVNNVSFEQAFPEPRVMLIITISAANTLKILNFVHGV